MVAILLAAAFPGAQGLSQAAPIPIGAPTNLWNVVSLGSLNTMDYVVDQQTGQPESDIVGGVGHAAFYWHFDNNGSASNTDGTLSFRARMGGDLGPGGFDNYLYVGVFADAGDSIDLFIGVKGAGSAANQGIKIWAPGGGANISPNTTTINAPASQVSYAKTAANYDWSPVNTPGLDPSLSNSNLDNDGGTDYFLSFSIPFSAVAAEAQRLAAILITDQTVLRYVLATATNENSFNQDIGGVPKAYDGNATYSSLGTISVALAPNPPPPPPPPPAIPEPGTVLTTGGALLVVGLLMRCKVRQ